MSAGCKNPRSDGSISRIDSPVIADVQLASESTNLPSASKNIARADIGCFEHSFEYWESMWMLLSHQS